MNYPESSYKAMIVVLVAAIIFLLMVGWVTKVQSNHWQKVNRENDQWQVQTGEEVRWP